MATKVRGGGVTVDGLSESIKALGAIDKRLEAEAKDAMRDGVKLIQKAAQSRGAPAGYRGPSAAKGWIGRSTTRAGAGVKLRARAFPWALKAEYGEKTGHVYGHPTRQFTFARRTSAPFKPPTSTDLFKNRGGYMIQPAIRELGPRVTRDASIKLAFLFKKHLGRR